MNQQILFLQRRLPDYRVAFFELLRKKLAQKNVQLSLCHGQPTDAERLNNDSGILPWALRYRNHYISKYLYFSGVPLDTVIRAECVVVPHEHRNVTMWLVLGLRSLLNRPTFFFGHGDNFQKKRQNRLIAWVRRRTPLAADRWLCYTSLSAERLKQMGVNEDRITVINNSTDCASLNAARMKVTPIDTAHVRKQFHLRGSNIAIFLGSLHEAKKIEFLLSCAPMIRSKVPDFELLIMGDGPKAPLVENATSAHNWISWAGHVPRDQLPAIAAIAKCCLNPGMVGLSVVDCFALGLPTITTALDLHSPEIAYIKHDLNGLISRFDVNIYSSDVAQFFNDSESQLRLSEGCYLSAHSLGVGKMVENFLRGFEFALQKPLATEIKGTTSTNHAESLAPRAATARILIIWQRFLSNHIERLSALAAAAKDSNTEVIALEICSSDQSYKFESANARPSFCSTLFPGHDYNSLSARQVKKHVIQFCERLAPDLIFCPAVAFPEGMGAIEYRSRFGARVIIMDDAWEATDTRGKSTAFVKKLIHKNVDGAFIPGPGHSKYFSSLGIPVSRQISGVDVIDNARFTTDIPLSQRSPSFLFVGRLLEKKGIAELLEAYALYSDSTTTPWDLVIVGDGPLRPLVEECSDGCRYHGVLTGDALCAQYQDARCLVMSSHFDQWGLVINEACSAGMAIIASRSVGAALQLVHTGENGVLTDSNAAVALANAMRLIASQPDDALDAMGRASKARVDRDFPVTRFSDAVLSALMIERQWNAPLMSHLATSLWNGTIKIR